MERRKRNLPKIKKFFQKNRLYQKIKLNFQRLSMRLQPRRKPKIQVSQHKLRTSEKVKSSCLILLSPQYSLNQQVRLNFTRHFRVLQKSNRYPKNIAIIQLIVFFQQELLPITNGQLLKLRQLQKLPCQNHSVSEHSLLNLVVIFPQEIHQL